MCIKPLSPYHRLLVYCLEGSRFTSFPSQFIPKVKCTAALACRCPCRSNWRARVYGTYLPMCAYGEEKVPLK